MLRFITNRIVSLVPILFGVSLFAFLLVHLVPGDPIQAMVGLEASDEAIQTLREKYGLDRSLPEQYVIWLGNVVRGDFGRSIQSRRPVADLIGRALVPTAQLAVAAVALSLLIAVPAGVLSATRRGTWIDHVATFSALSGLSLPSFWLGILLIMGFSVQLGWLPSSGYVALWDDPLRAVRHLLLPMITLGVALAAATMRMTRGATLETMRQDYVRTARAKGLPERVVTGKHVFRNALL